MRLLILVLPLNAAQGCCCIPEPEWLSRQLLPEGARVFSGQDGFEDAVGRCNNAGASTYDVHVEAEISMTAYYAEADTDRIASDMLSDAGVYVPANSMHAEVVGRSYDFGRSGIGAMSGPQYRVIGGTIQCGFGSNANNSKEK